MNTEIAERLEAIGREWGPVKAQAAKVEQIETQIKGLPSAIEKIETVVGNLQGSVDNLQRVASARRTIPRPRKERYASDELAQHLAVRFMLGNVRSGRLDGEPKRKDLMIGIAAEILGVEQRAALTTSDIPLPTEYMSELRELIGEFGVARRVLSPFPIGLGTARPPRMGTRPTFGSIAMSGAFTEKSPTITFASLESHKVGGIVRVPREIDEQSIVPMGQFLARYGAVEFARAEDDWAFLADGTGTYESVSGVCQIADDNSKLTTLGAGLTSPDDAALDDFRSLRSLVNSRVLSTGAYLLHPTFERKLRTFNTAADPYAFVPNVTKAPGVQGGPTLDGYPIFWVPGMQAYTQSAAAGKYIGIFGDLSYWWFGEHGSPRMDFSSDVYFATDELATRFIEEIDFDYQSLEAAAVLKTAAS